MGSRKLRLIAETETRGAVYTVQPFCGGLLAGVNSQVQFYEWQAADDNLDARVLKETCRHYGHILALHIATEGRNVVVGDLMKSVCLLRYKPAEQKLEEVAQDHNSNWMTAVHMLGREVFIGAENNYNLFTLKYDAAAETKEERQRPAALPQRPGAGERPQRRPPPPGGRG